MFAPLRFTTASCPANAPARIQPPAGSQSAPGSPSPPRRMRATSCPPPSSRAASALPDQPRAPRHRHPHRTPPRSFHRGNGRARAQGLCGGVRVGGVKGAVRPARATIVILSTHLYYNCLVPIVGCPEASPLSLLGRYRHGRGSRSAVAVRPGRALGRPAHPPTPVGRLRSRHGCRPRAGRPARSALLGKQLPPGPDGGGGDRRAYRGRVDDRRVLRALREARGGWHGAGPAGPGQERRGGRDDTRRERGGAAQGALPGGRSTSSPTRRMWTATASTTSANLPIRWE